MSADKHRETMDASMISALLAMDAGGVNRISMKVSLAAFVEAFCKARRATCSVVNCKVLEGGAILLAFAETADL